MIEQHDATNRATWLAGRQRDLTASDLGASLGIDRYKSMWQLYQEKSGRTPPVVETNLMWRGRVMEYAAVAALRERYPHWDIRHPLGIYLRDPDSRLGATPDVIAEDPDDPGLLNLQIKTVTPSVYERDWTAERGPFNYELQTMAEGYLLNAKTSYLVAFIISTYGAGLELVEVPRHAAAEARIREMAREFWDNIAAGVMPKPNYAEDAELIRLMHPPDRTVAAPLDLTDDNRLPGLLEAREARKAVQKAAEAECKAIDAEIVDKLDGATSALLNGWRVSHTMVHVAEQIRNAYDYPKLTITRTRDK